MSKSKPQPKLSKPKSQVCLWKGPYDDGITCSLLSKFLVCRERFRLRVVEGLKEDKYDSTMEFGSMWHAAEEAHSAHKPWGPAVDRYYKDLLGRYPADIEDLTKWYRVCNTQFPLYIDYWKKHSTEVQRKPIAEEFEFRVPYQLPSGRVVYLRGKVDALFQEANSIYIQENKTKGRIEEEGLEKSIALNLQSMFYHTVLRLGWKDVKSDKPGTQIMTNDLGVSTITVPWTKVRPKIVGTLYNVVRRPLGQFQKHCIRPRKGEADGSFYRRLSSTIRDNSDYFFYRWKCLLTDNDMKDFQTCIFNPILEQLMDWWEWIKIDPFHPWRAGNTVHWQHPYGVYNPLGLGFSGDYFDYFHTGKKTGLIKSENLFPELTKT